MAAGAADEQECATRTPNSLAQRQTGTKKSLIEGMYAAPFAASRLSV